MIDKFVSRLLSVLNIIILLISVFLPQSNARAANPLTVEPITWNVIGLDSNRPAEGPKYFPIGIRSCNPISNSVTFNDVEADFVWLSGGTSNDDTYIRLRPGSLDPIQPDPQVNLAPGSCYDFYFEVELNQVAGAFDQTRRYRVDVTYDDPDTGSRETSSTPTPRELYVEYLISQNRNSVQDIELDTISIPVGGVMDLMVGETYTISMDASTATQGYEQIESFIHFPNTIFQVLAVNTSYSADSINVPSPNDKLYADSCVWENDPDNPNYRSCLDVGKNGGLLRVDYTVKIIGGAGTSDTINSLIYDFSGSSYHYNADFPISYRVYNIVGPSDITIDKRFLPDSIVPGDSSTLTITINNPTSSTIDGVNFTDPLPPGMVVDAIPNSSTNSCGSPTFTPVAGANLLSFSAGTLAPNSNCTIKVDVTVAGTGTFNNTTNNLYINSTVDTGNTATDILTAGTAVSCTPGQEMARWEMDPTQGLGVPPLYWTKAGNVSTALASSGNGAGTVIDVDAADGNPQNSWSADGFDRTGSIDPDASAYLQFQLDSSKYSDVEITLDFKRDPNWEGSPDSNIYIYSSTTGLAGSFTAIGSSEITDLFQTINLPAFATGASNTYFRIFAIGAINSNSDMAIDNIIFTGCLETDPPPTLTKAFGTDPIKINETSLLTFTIDNTDPGAVNLTGINFSDVLPAGLEVANPPNFSTTCGGTPTWAPAAGDTILDFGTPAGGTLAAGNTCTAEVEINPTAAGDYENISGYISSDQSGENKSSSGYATDTLKVIAPPAISKSFSDAVILRNTNADLSFTISNPNLTTDLTGIGFSDTLPAGLDITAGSTSECGGTLTLTDSDPDTIVLSGGSLLASSSCSFVVTVTGISDGDQDNLTGTVTSTEGGDGNTASASIYVEAPTPRPKILKQIGLSNGPNDNWSSFIRIDSLPTNVYYKFIVENIGNVDLTNIRVFDPPGDYPGSPISCTFYYPEIPPAPPVAYSDPLSPGEFIYCITGPVTVNSLGSVTNIARAYGEYTGSDYSFNESEAEYATPALTLAKSITSGDPYAAVNDVIDYSFLVTNSGFVDLEGPVTVSDNLTTVTCPDTDSVGDFDNYLDPGESLTCTASYTVDQADLNAGSVTNIADASADGTTSATDTATATATQAPELGLVKNSTAASVIAAGQVLPYDYVVSNIGNIILSNVTLTDNNTDNTPVCVPAQPAVLNPGETMLCTAQHTVTAGEFAAGGNISNTATADSNESAPVLQSLDIPIITIFDPPFGIKEFDDSGLPLLRWTMIWINDSNSSALDVVVNDPIPAGSTFVAGSLQCIPRGSSSTAPGPGTCDYDSGNNRVHWEGTIGPDPGATGETDAANEVVITFLVNIPSGLLSSSNTAVLDADLNGNGTIDPGGGETTAATASASWVRSSLPPAPDTGFEPGVVTEIPQQSQNRLYQAFPDLWLEIPALDLKLNIVGVPLEESYWDLTWLSDNAGWLEGSAFPSHAGNSILTSHVYLPSGFPGPFKDIHQLKWDDQVIIHAFGRQYIYQVRTNRIIHPDDPAATRHEEYPWITLLTCKGYNKFSGVYDYRVMIRGVLVDVKPDPDH